MSNLDESFEYLSPFQFIIDTERRQNIFRRIVYENSLHSLEEFVQSHPSQPSVNSISSSSSSTSLNLSSLCSYCLQDLSRVLTETEKKSKEKIYFYDRERERDRDRGSELFGPEKFFPQDWDGNEREILKEVLELEEEQKEVDGELKRCSIKEQELDHDLASIDHEIQQAMLDINGLEWELMQSQEEVENISILSENARIETALLSQTPATHSLYSMSWAPTSSPSPTIPSTPAPSSLLYLTSSLQSVFMTSNHSTLSSISPPPLPSSPLQKQKILSINRIRVSYCPIPSANLNWREICLGWTLIGSFLQGILYELEGVRACWSQGSSNSSPVDLSGIGICYTYSMVMLRGKIILVNNVNQIGEERTIRRLFCSEDANRDKQRERESLGASSEYILSLICLGIIVIEGVDTLNYLAQNYRPFSIENDHEVIDFLQQPSLTFLKSFSFSMDTLQRKWPKLEDIATQFSTKDKLVNLVNDILLVIYNLSLR